MGSAPTKEPSPTITANQPPGNRNAYGDDYDADYDTGEAFQTGRSRGVSLANNPAAQNSQNNSPNNMNNQNNMQNPNNANNLQGSNNNGPGGQISPTQVRRAQEIEQMQMRQGVIQEEDEGEGEDAYDSMQHRPSINVRPVPYDGQGQGQGQQMGMERQQTLKPPMQNMRSMNQSTGGPQRMNSNMNQNMGGSQENMSRNMNQDMGQNVNSVSQNMKAPQRMNSNMNQSGNNINQNMGSPQRMNSNMNQNMSQNMNQNMGQGPQGGRFSEYIDEYGQVNVSRGGPGGTRGTGKRKKKKKKGKKKKVKQTRYYVEGGGGTIEMPKFTRFVMGIKSNIPYPVYLEELQKRPGYLFFNFTTNTNVFDVLEEEKLFLSPVTELTKIFEAFNEGKRNPYVDKQFPPSIESFTKNPDRQALYKNLVWRRFSESIPPHDPITLFDDLNYNEITPGRLANFAFQSMIVILSGQPGVLPANFPDINDQSETVFAVWMNDGGQWRPIIVDDYFPYDPVARRWAFCSTEPNVDLWVLVLEKAFAKLYGSYDSLLKGHPAHYIHDLTGSPYDHYYFDDEENFWDFLTMLNSETSIVVAMNKDPDYLIETESCLEKKPSYSYEVVNQATITLGEKIQRLIQLSNVLDPNDWDGDWSVNSNLWTNELMQQLNPEGYPDDAFWISIEDFLTLSLRHFKKKIQREFLLFFIQHCFSLTKKISSC